MFSNRASLRISFDLNNPLMTLRIPAKTSRGNSLLVAPSPQIEYKTKGPGQCLALNSAREMMGKRGERCSKYALTRCEMVSAESTDRLSWFARNISSPSASPFCPDGGMITRMRPFPSSDTSHLLCSRRSYASAAPAGRDVCKRNDRDVGPADHKT